MGGRTGVPQVKGTYQRVLISGAAARVAGTEVEQIEIANVLYATGKDEEILWARFQVWTYDVDEVSAAEWMLLKCLQTDALQDLNDTGVVELLLKRKAILKRGYFFAGAGLYDVRAHIKWSVNKVNLNDGEELRMLWRPVLASTSQGVYGELEYRIAGA